MLLTILAISIFVGLFFRSIHGFYGCLFALLLLIYPIPIISLLTALGIFAYISNKGTNHEQQSKLHSSSDRDNNN